VPAEVRFRTRHELALQMLDERGPLLPHGWVAGDDEMGRCSWFREQLRQRGERYLLAVPANTSVRDLAAPAPPYAGKGPRPKVPFRRADRCCQALPATAWQTVEVRDGEKGPLVVQVALLLVQARTGKCPSEVPELLVVFRERQGDGNWKHDYLLSNAALTTAVEEWARVFKAEHRIEECLKRAKGEAGLGDYQVRTWEGWYHHQTLSLLAVWFLTQETQRGKKVDSGVDGASAWRGDGPATTPVVGLRPVLLPSSDDAASVATQRGSTLVPLEATQPLATATI
jgi:SRSO17 transposase